jgi:phage gp37-like protein
MTSFALPPDKHLSAIRKATAAYLAGLFPQIKTVAQHEGEFNRTTVKKISLRAPAFHVAILGIRPIEHVSSGGVAVTMEMAVFVTTKDAPGDTRDRAALSIAAGLMLALDRYVPVLDRINLAAPATKLTWRNLFEPDEQESGTMISVLGYAQMVNLGKHFSERLPAELFLKQLYVGDTLVIDVSGDAS